MFVNSNADFKLNELNNIDVLVPFAGQLKRTLGEELPGIKAHQKMDPLPFAYRNPDGREPKKSAVMILFYQENGELKFPLIQRSIYNGAHSGQVSLPGGKYEKKDNDLIDTALRETSEEIGIAPDSIEILGGLSKIYVPPSNFDIHPVVGIMRDRPNFIAEPREVSDIYRINVTDLLNPNLRRQKTIKLSSNKNMDVPCFEFLDKVVWGATAMILSELSTIIERSTL